MRDKEADEDAKEILEERRVKKDKELTLNIKSQIYLREYLKG